MPEELRDSVLGELNYDEEMEWWKGQIIIGEEQAKVFIWAEPNLASQLAELTSLQANLERFRTHAEVVRRGAAARMLDLAEYWRDEDEEPQPITLEGFLDRISLKSVELSTEQFTVYYDDGDLFAGHLILVRLDKDMQIQSADIAG